MTVKSPEEIRREGRRRRTQQRNQRRAERREAYGDAQPMLRPTLGPQVALCRVLLQGGNIQGSTILVRALLESFIVGEHLAAKGFVPEGRAMDVMLANLRSCKKLTSDEFLGLMKAWEHLERDAKPEDICPAATALGVLEGLLTGTWDLSPDNTKRRKKRFAREGNKLIAAFDPSPQIPVAATVAGKEVSYHV
ncbi:MAG: hypothetical protein AAGD07_13845 [Planctomycetota bacterium]